MYDPLRFRRVHHSGTEVIISEHADSWQIRINFHQAGHNPMSIVGFLTPTIDEATKLADKELLKHGHICDKSCKPWIKLLTALPC